MKNKVKKITFNLTQREYKALHFISVFSEISMEELVLKYIRNLLEEFEKEEND